MFDDLAHRADRAMRTMGARRTAEETYGLLASHAALERAEDLLAALATRRAWQRQDERHFVCTFGTRRGTLTVPSPFDPIQLAHLITRVEINVVLGDSDPAVLADLQALAQRELHLLIASDEAMANRAQRQG
jgi:hypothetical protein